MLESRFVALASGLIGICVTTLVLRHFCGMLFSGVVMVPGLIVWLLVARHGGVSSGRE